MTVQEAQATITSTEFLKWMWFLDWRDTQEFNRQDYYLAQIAADITRGQVKPSQAKKIKVKDKLLKFNRKKDPTPISDQQRIQKSKSFWKILTGLKGNKKLRKKRKLPKKAKKE